MPQLVTALPAYVVAKIDSIASKGRERENLYRLARYFFGKYQFNGVDLGDWIQVSVLHLRNQVGTHYKPYLDKLVFAGIVERDDRYQVGKTLPDGTYQLGQCKKYRIDPTQFESDPEIIKYSAASNIKEFDNSPIIRNQVNLLSRLQINLTPKQLRAHIADFVTPESIAAKCKYGKHIPNDVYTFEGKTYDLATWQKIAEDRGVSCILYRDRFYLANLDVFINQHVKSTEYAYYVSALRLKYVKQRANITCNRNETNNRLDTNLTNTPTELLNLIKLDGEHLASIDLKNSQFLICAAMFSAILLYINQLGVKHSNKTHLSVLKMEPQMLIFYKCLQLWKGILETIERIEISTINVTQLFEKKAYKELIYSEVTEVLKLAQTGKFYDYLTGKIEALTGKKYTRDETKKACFVAAFASHRYNKAGKRVLRQVFPIFLGLMDNHKRLAIEAYELQERADARDAGNADLAVTLQKIESHIFIDCILATLIKKGYRVFSKHDSILCRQSDVLAVKNEIDAILGAWFGVGGFSTHIDYYGKKTPENA